MIVEQSYRFILFSGVRGLKNISIDIPLAVAAGTTVNMSCGYDLESDTLYVMKWYYKGSEFFRYVPKELPPTSTFGELGNKVIVSIRVLLCIHIIFSIIYKYFIFIKLHNIKDDFFALIILFTLFKRIILFLF